MAVLVLAHETDEAIRKHPERSDKRNIIGAAVWVGFMAFGGYGAESFIRWVIG